MGIKNQFKLIDNLKHFLHTDDYIYDGINEIFVDSINITFLSSLNNGQQWKITF